MKLSHFHISWRRKPMVPVTLENVWEFLTKNRLPFPLKMPTVFSAIKIRGTTINILLTWKQRYPQLYPCGLLKIRYRCIRTGVCWIPRTVGDTSAFFGPAVAAIFNSKLCLENTIPFRWQNAFCLLVAGIFEYSPLCLKVGTAELWHSVSAI